MSARRDRAIRGAVLAIPLALALPGAQRAVAHLALARTSLVALTSAADGVVVARAEGATDETGRTAFALVAPLAGRAPPASFVASGPAPLLRYRTGELAVVLLERPADAGASPGSNRARPEWRSPQAAGTGIELASAAEGESVRPVLERLWAATHGSHAASTVAEPATTAALVAGLGLPVAKLRYFAALDLSGLAHHPEAFSSDTRAALAGYGSRPGDDPALGPVIASVVQTLEGGSR